jgi:hypothetical protein
VTHVTPTLLKHNKNHVSVKFLALTPDKQD